MSWFISFIIAGAVFTSANDLSGLDPSVNSSNALRSNIPVLLDETERFQQTYPFSPDGKIEVANINGSISIEGWDEPKISLEAVKIADTKQRLADVKIVIDAANDRFSVSTDYKSRKNRKGNYSKLKVEFKLKVPRTAYLDEIETVNGSVEVSNMTNYTEVKAVNGEVKVWNLQGTAKLATVNGSVSADFGRLKGDSTISLSTVFGAARIKVLTDINATVKANTLNGEISNDFGLTVRKGKYVGRSLYGKIGSGEVKIRLSSVNGAIAINKKEDGGTPNPVLDLLPENTSDVIDESFETGIEKEFGKFNENFEKALKESSVTIESSQKEIEKAMKAAEAAMTRITPEIAAISAENLRKATEAIDGEVIRGLLEGKKLRMEAELAAASEALYFGRSPFMEEKHGTFEVVGAPLVTIDARDVDITVRGWDKPEVRYSLTRLKRNAERAAVDVSVSKDKSKVKITVASKKRPAWKSGQMLNRTRIEVYVPKKSNLKILSNREIRLEGVTGELELIGSTGAINVRDSVGRLTVGSSSGTVRIIGFAGELQTRSGKGDVYLEGDFKKISSKSCGGKIYLTLSENANAVIRTNKLGTKDGARVTDDRFKLGVVSLYREGENTWRVGKGKGLFSFDVGEGVLFVRPKSSLSAN